MANSVKSTKSAETCVTIGRLTKEEITQMLTNRVVSLGEECGYFTTKADVNRLLDNLETSMEKGSSVPYTEMIELHAQLSAKKAELDHYKDMYTASQGQIKILNEDLAGAKESLAAAERLSAAKISELEKEASTLKKSLTDAHSHHKALKKEKGPKDEEVSASAAEITRLNNRVQEADSLLAKEKMSTMEFRLKVQKLERDLENMKALSARQASKTYADVAKEPLPPLEQIQPTGSRLIDRTINEKARAELLAEAELAREDARERAFKLLIAAREVDPKNWVGWKSYADLVFKKVKTASYKKRKQYLPLLDKMSEGLRSKSGPALNSIKDEFSSLFSNDPIRQAKELKETPCGNETWWQALKFDFWLFRKKAEIKYREWRGLTSPRADDPDSVLRRCWKWLQSWWKPKPSKGKEKEVL